MHDQRGLSKIHLCEFVLLSVVHFNKTKKKQTFLTHAINIISIETCLILDDYQFLWYGGKYSL